MTKIQDSLVRDVRSFLDRGDRGLVNELRARDRQDIEAQAIIRYLLQVKHWPLTPGSEFSALLDRFFGHYEGKVSMDPLEYQEITGEMIKEAFNYECVVVIAQPRPEKKLNPGKVTRRPKMVREEDDYEDSEVKTGSIDTSGASERLKKTIAIQRGQ